MYILSSSSKHVVKHKKLQQDH